MPEVLPFEGIRYSGDRIGDMTRVVVPPYDVISESERSRMAEEPYSPVRLTLDPSKPDDTDTDNRYTRSRDLFRSWMTDGILVRDKEPAYYVLSQEFEWHDKRFTRRCLVGACRLHEWSEGIILPHEQILEGPRADRQNLIETTSANYEPIFGLALGDDAAFANLLEQSCRTQPLIDARMPNGERHSIWRVETAENSEFRSLLTDTRIIIADGHHRYTASLAVRNRMNSRLGPGPWDYVMMAIAPMDDPGLLILPTHRIVDGLPALNVTELLRRLDDLFMCLPIENAGELEEALEKTEGPAFGMVTREGCHLLVPWNLDDCAAAVRLERSPLWKRLDVAVLHGLIFDRYLGIGAGESPFLRYTRDAAEAMRAVTENGASLAFLMKATPKESVRQIALGGETMPQKSTFFYPKLATGLVMRDW